MYKIAYCSLYRQTYYVGRGGIVTLTNFAIRGSLGAPESVNYNTNDNNIHKDYSTTHRRSIACRTITQGGG